MWGLRVRNSSESAIRNEREEGREKRVSKYFETKCAAEPASPLCRLVRREAVEEGWDAGVFRQLMGRIQPVVHRQVLGPGRILIDIRLVFLLTSR